VVKKATDFADSKYNQATNYLDSNYNSLKDKIENTLGVPASEPVGSGKMKKKRQPSAKMLKRNALVKAVMKKHGVSMIEASKLIKQHNLM
jgi:hypothetical protein